MGLLGRKLGMTRVFHDDGTSLGWHGARDRALRGHSATDAGEAWVRGLQLGFEERSLRHLRRSEAKLFES